MASDCLLALAGHDPDRATPKARAGALLCVEFLNTFRGLVRSLSKT